MTARAALVIVLVGAAGCRAEAPVPRPEPAPARPVEPTAVVEGDPPQSVASDDAVHGVLEEIDGIQVLRVWGSPAQMGHAQGVLLRAQIIDVLDGYALEVITPAQLEAASGLFATVVQISPRLRDEAEGIVAGMKASGSAFVPKLDRDLRPADLLVMGAMTDLVAIGCSSVSAWGEATQASLGGEPVVVRNLDWDDNPALLRNQVVVVYSPSAPERQRVVSVSFAGYLGCLSCINEAGVTTLFNMGHGDGAASMLEAATGFAPANMLLRDVLERRDVDGDGQTRADDVEAGLRSARHAGSYIVHVVEPSGATPARVLEVEADGVHRRDPGMVASNVLAATNHLRGKEGPQACRRYDTIARTSASRKHLWDEDSLWTLARSVRLPDVVHTIAVQPRTRALRVWFREPGERAGSKEAGTSLRWDVLAAVPSAP